MAERDTRYLEVVVAARSCGFDSRRAYRRNRKDEMGGDICEKCGKPVVKVPAPGSGWIHKSARDALDCIPVRQNGGKKAE